MGNDGKSQQAAARRLRLQGALRENLRRRKEQARARAGQEAPDASSGLGPASAEQEISAEAPQVSDHAKSRRPR